MKYICDPHIVPSVVPADSAAIIQYAERSLYARALHIDIADGRFAANKTWPYLDGQSVSELKEAITRCRDIAFSAHLMIESPQKLGVELAALGCGRILAHIEAFESPAEASAALSAWKKAGAAEVGLALKIDTPLASLQGVTGLDFAQLMSIDSIGAQGEPFDDRVLSRVEELHAEYPDLLVAIDGGVNEGNIEELVRAGANRLIVGHVLAESENPERTFTDMLERAMRGCMPPVVEEAAVQA